MPQSILFLTFIVPVFTVVLILFVMNWMNRYLNFKKDQNELLREAIKAFSERRKD